MMMYNMAACLKQSSNFGYDIYMNVCTGSASMVPWGNLDWFNYSLGIGLIVGILTASSYAIYQISKI